MAVRVSAPCSLLYDLRALNELAVLVAAVCRSADRGGKQRQGGQGENEMHDDPPYPGGGACISSRSQCSANAFDQRRRSEVIETSGTIAGNLAPDHGHRFAYGLRQIRRGEWLFQDDRVGLFLPNLVR